MSGREGALSSLRALQAALLDGRAPEGLVAPGIERRIEVLRHGLGARTRPVLEQCFPETRRALGDARWEELGRAYSLGDALSEPNLNEIPRGFPDFLEARGAPAEAVALARIERAAFECAAAERLPAVGARELAELTPSTRLVAQPGVRVVGASVVSRVGSAVRVNPATAADAALLEALREPREVAALEGAEAGFFVRAVKGCWLAISP